MQPLKSNSDSGSFPGDDILKCYKVFDLEPGASADKIRFAYVELSHVWDPSRHVNNPILRSRAEQKRYEIEQAYQAFSNFLPELRRLPGPAKKSADPDRDFKEMTTELPMEATRAVMGILAGIVILLVFAWAFFVLRKGRTSYPRGPNPEAVSETVG